MSETKEQYAKRIIEHVDKNHDFVYGDDGYCIYWVSQTGGGLTADALRVIADELDRRNADWDANVQQYFDR
jgi:hypothetical protein